MAIYLLYQILFNANITQTIPTIFSADIKNEKHNKSPDVLVGKKTKRFVGGL